MEETQRTGRQELRELMDLKLERFDARMGERLAELKVELSDRIAQQGTRALQWNVGLWLTTMAAIGALKFVK